MPKLSVTLLLLALVGCASTRDSTPSAATSAALSPVEVQVVPAGEVFRARFSLPTDAPLWVFHRSAVRRSDSQPWRPDSWSIATPGVELARIGRHDVMRMRDGSDLPRIIEISFSPAAVDLIADYDPALVLTDGTVALFSGAFSVFPAPSTDALADTTDIRRSFETVVRMTNPEGQIFYEGRYVDTARLERPAYAIYGDVTVDETTSVARIVDPALPTWIIAKLDDVTPKVFDFYQEQLGPHAGPKPLVIASYKGAALQGISQSGSVLPGMIAISFEGSMLSQPNKDVRARASWFIAHEGAHFWLGNTIMYDSRGSAWITEGGAELMAIRATEAIDPTFDAGIFTNEAYRDCAADMANSGIEKAHLRNEQRPYYACGLLFALTVDRAGATRGQDFFDFVKLLIEQYGDGRVGANEWLSVAQEFGVSAERVGLMRRLLKTGSKNAGDDLDSLLSR